jgi:hypothetical protein
MSQQIELNILYSQNFSLMKTDRLKEFEATLPKKLIEPFLAALCLFSNSISAGSVLSGSGIAAAS